MSCAPDTVPTIFIDGEELLRFMASPETSASAYAYEWEGEKVIHIRQNPPVHSFGIQRTAMFIKQGAAEQQTQGRADYVVTVCDDGRAWVVAQGETKPVEAQIIPAKEDLYSRNKGLIELNILENKRVMIVGLGSFGSQISIELAKAGVGHFALMDFDRVELHNLARHTSTVNDLGRLKTDVLYDAIIGKNPYATVDKFPIDINDFPDLLLSECEKADLVICATDNNRSRFNLSEALVKSATPGIFGRAITRAEGGDVFRYLPGGPCYCCLLGNGWYNASMEEITDEASARRDGRIAAYMSAEDASAVVQVGLSADIEPMCNMMVKLALVELSRGSQSGISSLEDEFPFPFYIWANRRERNYSNWASFANPGKLPTIMRWYGVELERDKGCSLCGNASSVDTGELFMQQFGDQSVDVVVSEDIDLDSIK